MTIHPDWQNLALYAGGDLGWLASLRVRRHLQSCAACRMEVEGQVAALEGLVRGAMTLPDGIEWNDIAAEMRANINLGLQMGEIAETVSQRAPAPAPESLGWRAVVVCASLAVIAFSGWYLQRPHELWTNKAHQPPQVTFSLPAGSGERLTTAEIGEGVKSRYVDQDSGQVTIQHVFTE